jgi:FkbM family methyltransferase
MILISNTEIVKLFYDKTIESNTTEFIEVGCYEGSASKHLSTKMPNCKVTAYEANPVNFAHFSKELNAYNITYVNKAICEYDGETTFHLLDSLKTNIKSSLSKRTKAKRSTPVSVKCNTLDTLHYHDDHTYSLWIDAEGHGYEVLQGASKLLDNTKYILIEVEKHSFWVDQKLDTDTIDLLKSKNFTPIAYDRDWTQYNILFKKNSNS